MPGCEMFIDYFPPPFSVTLCVAYLSRGGVPSLDGDGKGIARVNVGVKEMIKEDIRERKPYLELTSQAIIN